MIISGQVAVSSLFVYENVGIFTFTQKNAITARQYLLYFKLFHWVRQKWQVCINAVDMGDNKTTFPRKYTHSCVSFVLVIPSLFEYIWPMPASLPVRYAWRAWVKLPGTKLQRNMIKHEPWAQFLGYAVSFRNKLLRMGKIYFRFKSERYSD